MAGVRRDLGRGKIFEQTGPWLDRSLGAVLTTVRRANIVGSSLGSLRPLTDSPATI